MMYIVHKENRCLTTNDYLLDSLGITSSEAWL